MTKIAVLILAAGKSTRMKSKTSKVMHLIAGRPVISYVIEMARSAFLKSRIMVVRDSAQSDLRDYLSRADIDSVVQKQALGTADAVKSATKTLKSFSGYVLILCGDVPLVTADTLSSFVNSVVKKSAKLGVLTMNLKNPASYGRIVRDLDGQPVSIVEAKDASENELKIREVNSGIMCFDAKWLFKSLKKVRNDNAKGEYYLTDLLGIALKERVGAVAFCSESSDEFEGINSRSDLARVSSILRHRINEKHMQNGVGILDPSNTHIDADAVIGGDTIIMPYSFIRGKTKIGSDCTIENGVVITDSVIGDSVHIMSHSIVDKSRIHDNVAIGPFARIRPESQVLDGAKVGNFVELKKCIMHEGSKASHLTYLGDAEVGVRTNIGCGTITCNYDGTSKHRTIIGDDSFIGSDTQFIAPVKIGDDVTIGAGSTITKDVPSGSLAISRIEQKVIIGWKKRKIRSKGNKRKGRG